MCRGDLLGPREASIFRAFFKRFVKVELRMIVSMMRRLRKKEKLAYYRIAGKFLKVFTKKK